MRDPLDTDREMPVVLDRNTAAARLLELLGPEAADTVWDEIIAPLYDARAMARDWRQGRCIRCSAVHPQSLQLALYASRRPDATAHRMSCPKYVGPLEHRVVNGHQALMGWTNDCSCGRNYPHDPWAEPPACCPDAGIDWRGPKDGEQR